MEKLRSISRVVPAALMLQKSAATGITPLMPLILLLSLNAGCQDDRAIMQKAEDSDPTHLDVANREVYEALQRIVPQVHWSEKPFHLVIEDLRQISGIEIEPDWQTLAAAAIERDAEVTMRVCEVTIKKVLELLLMQASLDYIVDNGAIVISTEGAIAEMKRKRNGKGVGSRF